MKQPRVKRCKDCGTQENLVFSYEFKGVRYVLNICKDCTKARRLKKTTCGKCGKTKPKPTQDSYCKECRRQKNKDNGWGSKRYQDRSADFKIDLWKFVEQIRRRDYKLYDLDLLKIVDFWSQIILNHHLYWSKSSSEQIKLMFKDLEEYLEGKKIKK